MKAGNAKSVDARFSPARKIAAFDVLGKYLLRESAELQETIALAALRNKWFTESNIRYALKTLAENFIEASLLQNWLAAYSVSQNTAPKKTGIVMAGNIPLAGFHDVLCALLSGNHALLKLSSKDTVLLPHLLERLCMIEPAFCGTFTFVERLKDFDAVIATGSNNSARHFDYYFGKYPRIIRSNRNSAAVLAGNETPDDLLRLGDDIFLYFGLGCRSVSKLYVPRGYDFQKLLGALEPFHPVIHHHGYKSNFDYQLTLLIMNKVPHIANDFLMLCENPSPASPIAALHFEYYDTHGEVIQKLGAQRGAIQCVVAECGIPGSIPFGRAQQPRLNDYADGVDTMQWLLSLA